MGNTLTDGRIFGACAALCSGGPLLATALLGALQLPSAAQTPPPTTPAAQGAPTPATHPPRVVPPGVARPGITRKLADLQTQAVFPVEGTPDWSAVADDAVWVSSARANHVVQLEATTNRPGLVAEVKRPCSGLAAAFGSIWAPSCGDHALLRLDPASGHVMATIVVDPAESEGGITAGAGFVWIVAKGGHLLAIDPLTNTVARRMDLPAGATNPVFGGGAVWISSFEQDRLLKVDPKAMTLTASVPVGPKPRFLTVGEGSVWTLNQGDGSVSRVDLNDATVRATIACGLSGGGGEIAFGEGAVWATLFDFPLTQIDPQTNQVVKQWAGQGGDGLRVGLGSLWLSNLRQGTVWRLSPQQK